MQSINKFGYTRNDKREKREFETFLNLHNADMKKWRLIFTAESGVSSNERPFDLRYGTAPMRWCHGMTLKFFV
jgi:hypothetical protein